MEAIATIHQEWDGVALCVRRHYKIVSYDHTNSTNKLFAKCLAILSLNFKSEGSSCNLPS
jgi:hypothetical protein